MKKFSRNFMNCKSWMRKNNEANRLEKSQILKMKDKT